jgi:GT2 family glycosyltransferase
VSIDVVVVTWRGREVLRSCLDHLARSTVQHRVIVVDNASGDGTLELLADEYPAVDVVALEENVGFGRACNAGAAHGAGDAIVLVNNDVDVEPAFLERLVAPLRDPAVGMVAGLTTVPGTGMVDGFGIQLDVTLAAYNRLRHEPVDTPPGRLAVPSGGAVAYRRTAYDAVGGFDDRLFAYGEDVDLGLRLRLAGWAAADAPDARGVHLGGATFGVDSPAQRRHGGIARGFLLRRYGVLRRRAWWRALLIELLVIGWGLVRHRTTVPLTSRIEGWRLAGRSGASLPVPPDTIDASIRVGTAVRRLAGPR